MIERPDAGEMTHQVKAPDALVGTQVQRSDGAPLNSNPRRFGTHFLGFLGAGHVKCCIHMRPKTHINLFLSVLSALAFSWSSW